MAGMPAEAAVFVQGSPAFEPLEGFRGTVLARYSDKGSPLLSGYLLGEKHLQAFRDMPLIVRDDRANPSGHRWLSLAFAGTSRGRDIVNGMRNSAVVPWPGVEVRRRLPAAP